MFFFKGSTQTKVDEKNRFVLPQQMRYGLVENGELAFTMGLGLGGCLTIYKSSDVDKIVRRFQKKQHDVHYQKFFTLFFSTLHPSTCDKLGRVVIPPILKKAAKIESEIVVAGVLNKVEIWPKQKYVLDLEGFLTDQSSDSELHKMMEGAFALLNEEEDRAILTPEQQTEYQNI